MAAVREHAELEFVNGGGTGSVAATVESDPIVFVGRYDTDEDREVVAWIASAFAYGRVATIQSNVGRILAALGPAPAKTLDRLDDFAGEDVGINDRQAAFLE